MVASRGDVYHGGRRLRRDGLSGRAGAEDDAAATLNAAILFTPLAALCLAGPLSCRRPALVTVLLVGVIVLSGLCVGALLGNPLDPFALAGVWVIQWVGGVIAIVVALVALVIGRARAGNDMAGRVRRP